MGGLAGGLAAHVVHGGFCDSFQPCGSKKTNKFCGKSIMNVRFDFIFALSSSQGTG